MALKAFIRRIFGVKQEEQQVRCFSVGPQRLAEILESQRQVLESQRQAQRELARRGAA